MKATQWWMGLVTENEIWWWKYSVMATCSPPPSFWPFLSLRGDDDDDYLLLWPAIKWPNEWRRKSENGSSRLFFICLRAFPLIFLPFLYAQVNKSWFYYGIYFYQLPWWAFSYPSALFLFHIVKGSLLFYIPLNGVCVAYECLCLYSQRRGFRERKINSSFFCSWFGFCIFYCFKHSPLVAIFFWNANGRWFTKI